MGEAPHQAVRAEVRRRGGVVLIVGAADSGKTTLARFLMADALRDGRSVAYVDAETDVSSVGPPATAGLRFILHPDDIMDPNPPAELRFVGSTSPQGVVVPYVVAASVLIEHARPRAELVVVDTAALVGGVVDQTIVYHLAELARPELVIATQRGEEMAPTGAMLERFLGVEVQFEPTPPTLAPVSPVDRHARRVQAFKSAFAEPLHRYRVGSGVFAPTLPDGFDQSRLDGMLVGVQDGRGHCLGLGALEWIDDHLRVATSVNEGMQGLRLGSMRIDLDTFDTSRVRLRQLIFGI